jgi:hypothetical protein
VQTLNNNQLHLETAFQASGVPSIVETDGTGTISGSISGTAASGVLCPTALTDLLREMKTMKSELHSLKGRNRALTACGGGGGRGATAQDDPWKLWRQWKYWCHSCGCNLSHDGKDCKSS